MPATAGTIHRTTRALGPAGDLVVDRYDVDNEIGRALVLPGFGRTADEYFHLSAILMHNGVSVVVPDFRFHPGRSAGTIRDFRLSCQVADVAEIVAEYEVDAVLATSLSFPPTLRVLAAADWRRRLIGIVPVVAPADTLKVVTGYDCAAANGQYDLDRTLNIDGFEVGLGLVADAERHDMFWTEQTLLDAERYRGSLHAIAGTRDDWVDTAQVRRVLAAVPGSELAELDEVGHDFGRSVRRARQMFQAAADALLRGYGVTSPESTPLDVVIRARQELKETGRTDRLVAAVAAP